MKNYKFSYSHKRIQGVAHFASESADKAYASFVRYLGFHPETISGAVYDTQVNAYVTLWTEF